MPDRTTATLHERTDDRKAARAARRELWGEAFERIDLHQIRINARETHGIPPARRIDHVAVRQADIDNTPWAVHHVVVEISRQGFPAPERVFVKIVVFRQQIV